MGEGRTRTVKAYLGEYLPSQRLEFLQTGFLPFLLGGQGLR